MKKILFTPLFLMALFAASGQHILTKENNMMRSYDEIIKQQVEYREPGRAGENVLWNFSKQVLLNDSYRLFYWEDKNSRLRGVEHDTRYYYLLSGDSLLLTGYENSTTLSINERPELLLKFPVHYNDSTFCYYNSNGWYSEKLKISAMGTLKTVADAYGVMILPNRDTLRNVLRVHTSKKIAESTRLLLSYEVGRTIPLVPVSSDSIDYRMATDTVLLEVETYRWYAKGYRYPIFETVRSITNKHGRIHNFFDVAFFYPPQRHDYLENDPDNAVGLPDVASRQADGVRDNSLSGFSYNIYPNPVQKQFTVEYYVEKPTEVSVYLYDIQGKVLHKETHKHRQETTYSVEINTESYLPGSYAVKIIAGNEVFGEVVVKK